MKIQNPSCGFTLIEILFAVLVMVIGLVGILALFPTGIDSSNRSVEDTEAGLKSQSFVNALSIAMANATYDNSTGNWIIQVSFDLAQNAQFRLPKFSDGVIYKTGSSTIFYSSIWKHHPDFTNPYPYPGISSPTNYDDLSYSNPPSENPNNTAYKFGGDKWVIATQGTISPEHDRSEPYFQYAISLDVRKMNDFAYIAKDSTVDGVKWTIPVFEEKNRTYEFRIHTYRLVSASPEKKKYLGCLSCKMNVK